MTGVEYKRIFDKRAALTDALCGGSWGQLWNNNLALRSLICRAAVKYRWPNWLRVYVESANYPALQYSMRFGLGGSRYGRSAPSSPRPLSHPFSPRLTNPHHFITHPGWCAGERSNESASCVPAAVTVHPEVSNMAPGQRPTPCTCAAGLLLHRL